MPYPAAVTRVTAPWQRLLAEAIVDPAELLHVLGLPDSLLPAARRGAALFPLRVPAPYLQRIRPGDAADPLLRQVLPLDLECETRPGFSADPLAESAAQPVPGLLKKYHGRALLIATGACAVHCRYCFRRHFPYADAHAGGSRLEPALAAIAADPNIGEVILSGGDPLTLSDPRLAELAQRLAAIPHIHTLRIHSRLPVVLPQRVNGDLMAWLRRLPLRKVLVLHSNHPAELDAEVDAALAALADAGVTLLNQAVLLRGVNDDADTLATLSERLHRANVLPYYLHLLDRVQGAAHFEVSQTTAEALIDALRARLPGYLVPRLVREIPGEPGKSVIA
ncbi:EF-P beta-lysylation protein EpmB [Immundisolibacter cernigliae]|uniref:L-lysine 2,3-aminomutase n=1 Tax=Immundisolibacter cernigliae TaxID=1810504 RepID=A0A1B1YWA4_9GAMM|nr:EF-P beta-lysylation protein EpmB [Immundisolibacter cernigliae]ANX04893.1 EF-P beta-lysylation protein EpmB [Immundisolibacter cernigliae]